MWTRLHTQSSVPGLRDSTTGSRFKGVICSIISWRCSPCWKYSSAGLWSQPSTSSRRTRRSSRRGPSCRPTKKRGMHNSWSRKGCRPRAQGRSRRGKGGSCRKRPSSRTRNRQARRWSPDRLLRTTYWVWGRWLLTSWNRQATCVPNSLRTCASSMKAGSTRR